jgi:hypothetical protein
MAKSQNPNNEDQGVKVLKQNYEKLLIAETLPPANP